ncbi:aminotransferase class I/II-fold pyridoxal phosphate-dependent enzyme [Halorussus amylolyticus]|uniref:aminotransferase class I/II-fold pyridoxal phosphate-dependent enzyme n=1 Tax=Halorussus amylolyticus TaxID=1126242 RepID=UPI00138F3888|nr:aminotransferase class I/II-fold pyridoxal phosphate-dependent enzyme [Halorussus amylolyticus]
MDIAPFGLERWFAEYEHEADIMLAESGIRSLDSSRFDLDAGELGYVIPTNGDPDFRAEVGERYDRSADEVLFTCGTQEANFLAFYSLMDDDSHAVVVTPTYQALYAVPEAIGDVTRVALEPPEWELDVDAVADAIRPETEVLVLNNPNNPTGRYHPQEKVEALYDLAEDNDAYLLCDEVYRLLDDDPLPPVASLGDRGISTASLTKAYGLAGLRFGWLVGAEEVVEGAWEWKDYTTISPGIIDQHVARQALGDSEAEILAENRDLAGEHHDMVEEFVADHDLSWHDPVGVNGFVTIPDEFEGSEAFCRAVVEEESVVLAPGSLFGYDDYFRIGFGLPTEELEDGLARVSACIERHRE